MNPAVIATWTIAALATAGVIARPRRWPEWIWAVAGAAALVVFGLIPAARALHAIGRGTDVYLFLVGMMLLSETARAHGVFDWIAAIAVERAQGSPRRLFALVYAAGCVVTTFLSNDATAVVLTPAVFAAARQAKAPPMPLLFACAMVANAASLVLPISNPANLVLYGGQMPPLGAWFGAFALPSVGAIAATFVALRLATRAELDGNCAAAIERAALGNGGRIAVAGIVLTASTLIAASAWDVALGWPTAIAGVATALGVGALRRENPLRLARHVAWGVLPLVAGLFVLVEALDETGVVAAVARGLSRLASDPVPGAAVAGMTLALVSNLMNNLPAGLIASTAIAQAQPPKLITDALLIGVDLGPNLSITGSLATILWLQTIRREGTDVTFGQFLKVGAVTMLPALAIALGLRLALG